MLYSNNLVQTSKDVQSYNNSVRNVNLLEEQYKKLAEEQYTNTIKEMSNLNLTINQLNTSVSKLRLRVDWLDRLTEVLL